MVVYVNLDEDDYEQPKVSESCRRTIMNKAETKQHVLLLALVLIINTIIIIIIAYNRSANTVRETVIKNELSDLFYGQPSSDIIDDSTVETNQVNDEYVTFEFVDQAAVNPDENNQDQNDYQIY